MTAVNPGIVVPLVVLPLLIVGVMVWYRRSIAQLRPSEARPVSGLRLTAEALHRAPSPPWRVVYEIGGALGEIDHVLVGPPGVAGITTVVADRPEPERMLAARGEVQLHAEAAIARGPLDELLRAAGSPRTRSVRVYWGVPDPRRPAADDVAHATTLVEGQRLQEWMAVSLADTTAPLDRARIDTVWRTIVMGIGRPDPRP